MSDSNDIHLLDKRRRNLEEESSAITDELTNSVDGKKPMGVTTPLVDEEGFPRADIDVYRARHLRKRLNEIRYDHSNIMKKIEGNLSSKNVSLCWYIMFSYLVLLRVNWSTMMCSTCTVLLHFSNFIFIDTNNIIITANYTYCLWIENSKLRVMNDRRFNWTMMQTK